jgi:hypothetical protein
MSGWKTRLEERDGELVPVLHYESSSDFDTREERELDRECRERH